MDANLPVEKIQTSNDLMILKVRIENGMTNSTDAQALMTFIDSMTWNTTTWSGKDWTQCRICGCLREWQHSVGCQAQVVL